MILAHGATGPAASWHWEADWSVIVMLVAGGAAYFFGLSKLRARGSRSRPLATVAWIAALGAAVVSLIGPLDAAAHDLFSVHMVQHLVLMLVVAPGVVAGRPVRVIGATFSPSVRRMFARASHSSVGRAAGSPLVVGIATAGVLGAWHIPVLYGAALHSDVVHAAEHGSFLVTAVAFWSFALGRRALGARAALMFAIFLFSGALGALLTFSGTSFYPMHGSGPAGWGLTPLSDQQLAGVIMWVPSGGIYVLSFAALFIAWMRRLEARMPSRPPTVGGAADG